MSRNNKKHNKKRSIYKRDGHKQARDANPANPQNSVASDRAVAEKYQVPLERLKNPQQELQSKAKTQQSDYSMVTNVPAKGEAGQQPAKAAARKGSLTVIRMPVVKGKASRFSLLDLAKQAKARVGLGATAQKRAPGEVSVTKGRFGVPLITRMPPEGLRIPTPEPPVKVTPKVALKQDSKDQAKAGQLEPIGAKKLQRTESGKSLLNTHRLHRDGRKLPSYYKRMAEEVSCPSELSSPYLTEMYKVPNEQFRTPDDVFKYRGYNKLDKIDEGAFGVVSTALRLYDDSTVAVKEVDLTRKRAKRVEEMKRELFVLQNVTHEHIVKLIEHFIINHTLVIIMEFCAGSNLTTYLKDNSIQEEEACHLFRQMAIAVRVLHRKGIAHRDVKLNNFLLDEKHRHVKIADFGLSVVAYKPTHGYLYAKTYCGTEPYMSPEILRRNRHGYRSYNAMYADVWALGVCLFAMLTRTFPFKIHPNHQVQLSAQMKRKWHFPRFMRRNLSEPLRDLVFHMLDPDCDRRITMNGVVSHPWLNGNELFVLTVDGTNEPRKQDD